MALTPRFPDTTTRNLANSVFSRTKRPGKWPSRRFSRTLRHRIGPTAYSRGPSVQGNGSSADFSGRYDTKSGQQRTLADQASVERALPLAFPDATTRNQPYSVVSLTKRPDKWPSCRFSRTLRHRIGPTAYSRGPSILRVAGVLAGVEPILVAFPGALPAVVAPEP